MFLFDLSNKLILGATSWLHVTVDRCFPLINKSKITQQSGTTTTTSTVSTFSESHLIPSVLANLYCRECLINLKCSANYKEGKPR